jgi:hypothetical protein
MRSLLLALALAASGLPGLAAAQDEPTPPRIYRWVDENGIAHYTTDVERIPKSLRRRFGLPAQPLARESLDARAPTSAAPASVAPPTPGRGPDAWAAQEKSAAPAVEAGPREGGPEGRAEALSEVPALQTAEASSLDRLAQLELRIAELAASIAADEDTLSAFIGDPGQGDAVELSDTPQFRQIAGRLPKRLQELEALRNERDALLAETTP